MSNQTKKVATEVVEAMIVSAEDYYRTHLNPDDRLALLTAGEDGRLDIEDGIITIHLLRPVELSSGTKVASITLDEPTAQQIASATSVKGGEVDQMLRLISAISGQAIGVIERIKSRDLRVIGAAANFFA